MRALTIRQPWAAAITYADKRVENRAWLTSYRGPVLIHAGKTLDARAGRHVTAVVRGLQLDMGAVLAVARLIDCHPGDGECTPWSEVWAPFHFVLDEVTALPLPIPWAGAQQLWTPPAVLVEKVREQLSGEAAAHVLREEAGPC